MNKNITEIEKINIDIINKKFWDEKGSKKTFSDPFFIREFENNVPKESRILDYGCGYGRLIKILNDNGYHNITGFEKSKGMLERAKNFLPKTAHMISDHLLLTKNSFDAVILSTVLCCDPINHINIIDMIKNTLRNFGILYFCDFLILESEKYKEKYNNGLKEFHGYGVYKTNEDIIVRHFSKKLLLDLFKDFSVVWSRDIEYVTMNNNQALQAHMILKKK